MKQVIYILLISTYTFVGALLHDKMQDSTKNIKLKKQTEDSSNKMFQEFQAKIVSNRHEIDSILKCHQIVKRNNP